MLLFGRDLFLLTVDALKFILFVPVSKVLVIIKFAMAIGRDVSFGGGSRAHQAERFRSPPQAHVHAGLELGIYEADVFGKFRPITQLGAELHCLVAHGR